VRKGNGFSYYDGEKKISDKAELARIKKLRVPPAWEEVWICRDAQGHIQATGFDARKRKQYRYHAAWSQLRNLTKFSRLLLFGEKLPLLRLQIEKDMARKTLDEQKVIATVISLMERTYIRIGNSGYEKANGSYGLTTLKDRHVKINGDGLEFSFKGKSHVKQRITVRNRRLARIVKQCRDIPGSELFQYFDAEGKAHAIDSGQVNTYIKAATGETFTAKDFRTWAGTLQALRAFTEIGEAATAAARKQKIVEAVDKVSLRLGNTRAVCRKYYIHPKLIELYEQEKLSTYLQQLDRVEKTDELTGWTADEVLLMHILRHNDLAV
jgi:DNA topoisomerase-1